MVHIPSLDTLLKWAEKVPILYKTIIQAWEHTPPRLQNALLRRLNPSLILGALAVIIDPYSEKDDPKVLLGYHSYRSRQPWALLGGALKKRYQEIADPGQAVVREVKEETGLDIEVTKLLAIDTDWPNRTINFYFECALRHGYPDLGAPLPSPEVTKLKWFRVSELPDDMYSPHKRFLTNVLPEIPRLPGVNWIPNQQRPKWWHRFSKAEKIRWQIWNWAGDPKLALSSLVDEARRILDCEVVSLFVVQQPIQIMSPDFNLPADIEGTLSLLTESSKYRGAIQNPKQVVLPLSRPNEEKLGLTAWLVRARPLGHAIRLHEDWLHRHPQVKSWTGQPHLRDGICHSLAAVAIVGRSKLLGLLKAENKMRDDQFVPFGPDDGYILEELATAAVPLLERLMSTTAANKDAALKVA